MPRIINIESPVITIPLGTPKGVTIDMLPKVLWATYDTPPYYGAITLPKPVENFLWVLNSYSVGTTSTGSPIYNNEKLKIDSNGRITNIPVDKQQEILLKGSVRNITTGTDAKGDSISYDTPVIYYISILVGGIDWNPASRFPAEIDPLDADMKEPVTTADIPMVDAYQYLISLQNRTQAETSQLESLKKSLSKKMILARDINWVRNCLLAVENAYHDLLDRLAKVEADVSWLYQTWLPWVEQRAADQTVAINNSFEGLIDNWRATERGLVAAREDTFHRVYYALKHYGGGDNGGGGWFSVPPFGTETTYMTGPYFNSDSDYTGFTDTTTKDNITIYNSAKEKINTQGTGRYIKVNKVSAIFKAYADGRWGQDQWSGNSSTTKINVDEYFHILVVRGHDEPEGRLTTISPREINIYKDIAMGDSNRLVTLRGEDSKGSIMLEHDKSKWVTNEIYLDDHYSEWKTVPNNSHLWLGPQNVRLRLENQGLISFCGLWNGTAGAMVTFDNTSETIAAANRLNLVGQHIHFRNTEGTNFANIIHGSGTSALGGSSHVVFSMGNGGTDGGSNFFIGKEGGRVIIQFEGTVGKFCGIKMNSTEGMSLVGLSQETLDFIRGTDAGGLDSEALSGANEFEHETIRSLRTGVNVDMQTIS